MAETILLVDDVRENREFLMNHLGPDYQYLEAEDEDQALLLLGSASGISLVLLSLTLGGRDGLTFYAKAQKLFPYTMPPVLTLSPDGNQEHMNRAYSAGIVGCFTFASFSEALKERIHSIIVREHQKQRDLEDVLHMMNTQFYKVMKVNLTTDDHHIIINPPAEQALNLATPDSSIVEWTNCFKEAGYVYEDDLDVYEDFTNHARLSERLREDDNDYLSCKYHRKINGEFRWVMMEILKSFEYMDDNQVIMVYIRDVHDEYLRRSEEFARLSINSAKTSIFNLTANRVEYTYGSLSSRSGQLNCTIDELVTKVSAQIPILKERNAYRKKFCMENLKKSYEKGIKNLTMEHKYQGTDGTFFHLRTIVAMNEDSVNGNIVGNFFAFDITNEYIHSCLPRLLFEGDNWDIYLIDTKNNELIYLDFSASKNKKQAPPTDYDAAISGLAENFTIPSEQAAFRKKSTIKQIKKQLDTHGNYEFTVQMIGVDGETHLFKNKYRYFHKQLGVILQVTEDITALSNQDVLTGGLNRQGFIKKVGQVLRQPDDENQYAILYMDIKRFKAINELFGAEIGDDILRMIPGMVSKSFLKPVVSARHTADRFVFLVDIQNLDYDRLVDLCTFKYESGGKTIMVYLHCGIFLIKDKTLDISSMCNRATIAERYIENEHIKPYALFEEYMSDSYIDRSALYNALPDALANKEFQPYYQPIFDAKTGEVVSAEALVRWFHPQWGFMNPGLFVPALEEGGYISAVDLLIANHVRGFLEEREKNNLPIVPVSVNLSRMDFYDKEMMNALQESVSATSLEHGFHRFEVTESSYMAITETDVSLLDSLRALGAKILIDDFGSGYSSFGTIADYDFDIIKLDMAFVQKIGTNPKVESIIHSLINMAHHLNAKVIAEGAETEEQVTFLRDHDCDYIQGYYFSKPLCEADFIHLLETRPIKDIRKQHKAGAAH